MSDSTMHSEQAEQPRERPLDDEAEPMEPAREGGDDLDDEQLEDVTGGVERSLQLE